MASGVMALGLLPLVVSAVTLFVKLGSNFYPVGDIAGKLPSYFIADLMGIPLEDGFRLYDLTEKMHAAADTTPTGDSLRLAVLAALNIADELFRCRDVTHSRDSRFIERAEELERLLDRVLMA